MILAIKALFILSSFMKMLAACLKKIEYNSNLELNTAFVELTVLLCFQFENPFNFYFYY